MSLQDPYVCKEMLHVAHLLKCKALRRSTFLGHRSGDKGAYKQSGLATPLLAPELELSCTAVLLVPDQNPVAA